MTPPGDNLEFTASGTFRYRLGSHRALLEAIKASLRIDPKGSRVFASGIHCQELVHELQAYVVVFRRTGNRIGLMDVFALPQEELLFERRFHELDRAYRGGKEAT